MKIGSLFSGGGGLDLAVEAVFGGRTVWHCEQDAAASKVLECRWPGVPNLGDITAVDWSQVEPVDVLCGGYPCQPFSAAGRRQGAVDERHLWPYFAEAISALVPRHVVLENVAGHLTLGFDQVVGDLSIMGYSVSWCSITASSVGAPHRRERIFVLAEDVHEGRICSRFDRRRGLHRDSTVRRLVPGSAEGVDVGQGAAGPESNDADLRREDHLRAATRPEAPRRPYMESVGSAGGGCYSARQAVPDSEGDAGGHCPGISGDGGSVPASSERTRELDGVDEGSSGNVRRSDSRGESSGPRPEAAGPAAAGSTSGRPVVGAKRWTVRADSLRGPFSEDGDDARWPGLRTASTSCAPVDLLPTPQANLGEHRRDSGQDPEKRRAGGHAVSLADVTCFLPTPNAQDGNGGGRFNSAGHQSTLPGTVRELLPTPRKSDGDGGANPLSRAERMDDVETRVIRIGQQWGKYEPAIRRWEALTRPAPSPTEPNTKGNPRLAAAFAEWMQGWPDGWCTDPAIGISRNDQLRIVGNGVVPQQAVAAIRFLLSVVAESLAVA